MYVRICKIHCLIKAFSLSCRHLSLFCEAAVQTGIPEMPDVQEWNRNLHGKYKVVCHSILLDNRELPNLILLTFYSLAS